MRINGNTLLQAQMVELPAELMQLQLRFTEKMLKVTIAEKALEQATESLASGVNYSA